MHSQAFTVQKSFNDENTRSDTHLEINLTALGHQGKFYRQYKLVFPLRRIVNVAHKCNRHTEIAWNLLLRAINAFKAFDATKFLPN